MFDDQSQLTETPDNNEKAEQPTNDKTGQIIEAGRLFARRRAEVEQNRKKPGEETLEEQRSAAEEALEQSVQEEITEMREEIKAEGKEDLSDQEAEAMSDTMFEIIKQMTPELEGYIRDLAPRLDHLIDESNQLRKDGKDKDALEKLSKFLEDEDAFIEKNIANETLRNEMQAYIRSAMNADKIVEEMESQTWKEIKSDIIDLVPVIGPVKMLREAAKGKTAGGETLEGTERAWHAAKATGSLVIDGVAIAGLVSGGTVSAVAEGGKVAASGSKVATIASRLGAEGVEVASAVKKFAALTRKTTKLTGAAKKIYKCGVMISKYPKLTASIVKVLDKRDELMDMYKKRKTGRAFTKQFKTPTNLPSANDSNLPEAPSKAA